MTTSIISFHAIGETLFKYQNFIIVIGLIISFSGGSWDITFHILSQPESFFSYPHTLVYCGIFIVISAYIINFRKNISDNNPNKKANYLILSGVILILAAGPFDFSWHLKFGLDGLLSPPHVTLLTGWFLVGFGNLRITINLINSAHLQKRRSCDGSLDSTEHMSNLDRDKNEINNLDYVNSSGNLIDEKGPILLKMQLVLNASFILLILSGFIYFFSLPFSETQFYNYNPDPRVALLVYGLGFPFLISSFFVSLLKYYPGFNEMVLLVGSFYIIIMLLTQIISNPFLFDYSWYYLLNIIPFVIIYLLNKRQIRKTFIKKIPMQLSPLKKIADNKKDKADHKIYIFYGLILAIISFTISFPLNTYILNEELYGYLVYQNIVAKVYSQLVGDYFIIIMIMSIVGGLLGYGVLMIGGKIGPPKDVVACLCRYFTDHKEGGR